MKPLRNTRTGTWLPAIFLTCLALRFVPFALLPLSLFTLPSLQATELPPTVRVVVALDGSCDFKTIQMAIDHAPNYAVKQRLVIEIKPGHYHERVTIP